MTPRSDENWRSLGFSSRIATRRLSVTRTLTSQRRVKLRSSLWRLPSKWRNSSPLMSWVGAFRKPRMTNSRGMSDPGSANRAGCFISLALKVKRPQSQRYLSTQVLAISRTPQPIQCSAAAGSTPHCCVVAYGTRGLKTWTSSAAGRIFFRRAIATWSVSACGCSSSDRFGRSSLECG